MKRYRVRVREVLTRETSVDVTACDTRHAFQLAEALAADGINSLPWTEPVGTVKAIEARTRRGTTV